MTTNPMIDWGLLVLREYEFIHHHYTSLIFATIKFFEKNKII